MWVCLVGATDPTTVAAMAAFVLADHLGPAVLIVLVWATRDHIQRNVDLALGGGQTWKRDVGYMIRSRPVTRNTRILLRIRVHKVGTTLVGAHFYLLTDRDAFRLKCGKATKGDRVSAITLRKMYTYTESWASED